MAFFYLVVLGTLLPYLLLSAPFMFTYLLTSFIALKTIHSSQHGRKPPVSPYWIPGLGHSLSFLWDTANLAKLTQSSNFQPFPVFLRFFNTEVCFVSGSDNIISVWRSKALEAKAVACFSLRYFFNTPRRAMKIYHTDSSGINLQPHPNSNTPFKDRYYFHTRRDMVGFFSGPGLKHFSNRFQSLLRRQISQVDVGHEWIEFADLYSFVQDLLIGPAIEAMCGPTLIAQNPTFVDDFWKFDSDLLYFFKGCPRWLAPRAWRNRNRILGSLKTWHAYAREHFDESCIEADGHDQFHGSPLMRSRQNYLPKIDSLDADALASQDLGLIWAENANSIPAVFWFIFELLKSPDLFSRAREEVVASQSCSSSPEDQPMDIDAICSQPFLQSVYAETLRLYTSLFSLRSTAHEAFKLGDWRIPKDKLIAVDSRVAHMDKSFWNTGNSNSRNEYEGPHPLGQFWAERFLEYADDPTSGPLRCKKTKSRDFCAASSSDSNGKSPSQRFTMEGLSGAWLPFGGGLRQCPGRTFAKREIILSFAVMASTFDLELLEAGPVVPDMKYYGLGTFPPMGKVPFKIRRREFL